MNRGLLIDLLEGLADVHEGIGDLSAIRERLEADPRAAYLRHYYEAILRRSPESGEAASGSVENRLQCALDFIGSDEFAIGHIGLLRELYPTVPAKFFLHAPKSGGSTVIYSQRESGDFAILMTPPLLVEYSGDRLDYYGEITSALRRGVRFFGLHGHPTGAFLVDNRLKREIDEVFSVLRDPYSTIISYLNFVLTRLAKTEKDRDIPHWEHFKQTSIDFSKAIPEAILFRILQCIIEDNPICRTLSGQASASKALESIDILDIRIIKFADLERYLQEEGLPAVPPKNVSTKFITNESISSELKAAIEAHITEDVKLFQHLDGGATPGRPVTPPSQTVSLRRDPRSHGRKRILYHSVHEALEYDDLRILHAAGFDVFSLGSYSDPSKKGNRLRKSEPFFCDPEDYAALLEGGLRIEDGRKLVSRSFVERFDAVIVNHDPNFIINNLDALANTLTIRRTLGQTTSAAEQLLQPYRSAFKTVRYSPREQRPGLLPADALIYFGKFPDQYSDHTGGDYLLTFMSSAGRDLARPLLADYRTITRGFNARLYGMMNEDIEECLGICPEDQQPGIYAGCRMYLYTHSLIACYTLNVMEAMLTGCPIIAPSARYVSEGNPHPDWSEGMYEIQDFLRGGAGLTYDSVEEARRLIATVPDDELAAMSERAKTFARERFDGGRIAGEWRSFLLPLLS